MTGTARNLVVTAVMVVAVVATALIAGRSGRGVGVRPLVSFGSGVARRAAPRGLVTTNGWVVRSGSDTLAVYAGTERRQPDNGLFVVVREAPGVSRVSRLVVAGSGAVTLLRPPAPGSESAATTATLQFVAASGATGTLALSSDRVTLSP